MAHRKRDKLIDKITSQYIKTYSITPEEYVIEHEKLYEITKAIEYIKEILSEQQFDILWLYCVEKWTLESIGNKYDVSLQAIDQRLRTIFKKINKNLEKIQDFAPLYVDVFYHESTLEAHAPQNKICYPHEFLMSVSVNGYWHGNKDGTKTYISKTECHIPEFLEQSFRCKGVKCPKCYDDWGENNCTRRINHE